MSESLSRFQNLLRELFQFDVADLDFGIYRIMNLKRNIIDRFITEDLPNQVNEELEKGILAYEAHAAEELKAAREKVIEALGEGAIDPEDNLAEAYKMTPAGKAFLAAQERARSSKSQEALEAAIYNHLYTFFSRYWQDGDFISKRRYSKKERYAIPYNGEEVYLYWANHDQYYVKTGEYFTDYTWKAPNGVTVHFKLKAADVEQNNVKGEKRFFLPRLSEIAWDAEARALTIPFEFRPLTEQENIAYGQKNQQEAIIAKALEEIPKHLPKGAHEALAALTAEKCRTDGTAITLLEHHLRQYTRRNTSDFFIHKDLKGFLSRELDFYLKNEVLNLDELEAAGKNLAEGWFQLMRLIKRIGLHIIEFLAQIEDFQKMLWEKKKFVTETSYVITVGNIPEALYPEIAENEAQWVEWKDLLHIDEDQQNLFTAGKRKKEKRIEFLKSHPSLPLDTRHFPPDFTDRLLASFDNLDDLTDGLLIHSENWQALNLLQEKYRERVKCVYIDPPFKTGKDFFYRDSYQDSSWLTLMYDRLQLARYFLSADGSLFLHLDWNANFLGRHLLQNLFSDLTEIIWNTNATRDEEAGLFSYKSFGEKLVRQHDTIFCCHASGNPKVIKLWKPNRVATQLPIGWLDLLSVPKINNPQRLEDYTFYVEKWDEGKTFIREEVAPRGEKVYPVGDIWNDIYSFMQSELRTSENFAFQTQKPENLLRRIIQFSSDMENFVLDFFAGSGTTLAVAQKLKRKWIGVEWGENFSEFYWDGVDKKVGLLGRMKIVLYGDKTFHAAGKERRSHLSKDIDWRGGGFFKYYYIEQYEDTLNNLSFDEDGAQIAMEFEDYLLRYMLKWETRNSETLLNVEKLSKPFDYCLHIHRGGETRIQKVDLPETFAYLIGLDVEKRQVLDNQGRRYLVYRGTTREGKKVVVIWRETEGWREDDYRRDREFVAAHKLAEAADLIYTNGDSLIPGACALDGVFKARMFSSVEG